MQAHCWKCLFLTFTCSAVLLSSISGKPVADRHCLQWGVLLTLSDWHWGTVKQLRLSLPEKAHLEMAERIRGRMDYTSKFSQVSGPKSVLDIACWLCLLNTIPFTFFKKFLKLAVLPYLTVSGILFLKNWPNTPELVFGSMICTRTL